MTPKLQAIFEKMRGRFGRPANPVDQVRAYRAVFLMDAGRSYVLPDLLEFSHFMEADPKGGDLFERGRLAGRRDMMLRIIQPLHLSPEEIFALMKGQPIALMTLQEQANA